MEIKKVIQWKYVKKMQRRGTRLRGNGKMQPQKNKSKYRGLQ